jgi:hypothetical protein
VEEAEEVVKTTRPHGRRIEKEKKKKYGGEENSKRNY